MTTSPKGHFRCPEYHTKRPDEMRQKPEVAVVYVRRESESEKEFLESWWKFGPGMECRFEMVVKYPWETRPLGWLRRLADITEGYVCLLNASSIIQCEGWLERLFAQASRPSVGMAGCSASVESFASNQPAWWRRRMSWSYPNPHIRTNAFVIRADLARAFLPRNVWTKYGEHMLESGRRGLTRRVIEAGFDPVVVDSEGKVFGRDEFPDFRSDPSRLMVTDRRCA